MDLNELQFGHYHPAENPGMHGIHAISEGNVVGYMEWAAKRSKHGPAGEITALRVRPDMRREGIASGMFKLSQQFDQPAEHSTKRTPEGTAFARSTGTRVPKLMKPLSSEATRYGPNGEYGISEEGLMQMTDPRREYNWLTPGGGMNG